MSTQWFINEDGEPYPYDRGVEKQTLKYPNDDHTPYATEAEAQAASDATETRKRKHVRITMVRLYQVIDTDSDRVEFETLDQAEAEQKAGME